MKTIAICNQKGGVGKTSTAITLSSFLALNGVRTLLVDLDPQGNTTSGLGLDKRSIEASIYHLVVENAPSEKVLKQTEVDKLFILPSNIELTGAEIELVNEMGRELRLKKVLSELNDQFDYAIIDCPPSLGLLTINALSAADSVLIPIQCEFYALEGLGQLMRTVDLVRQNLNEKLEIEGILMTMADNRTNLADQVIKEVRKHFADKVYETVIPRSIKMGEAPGFGKPIMLYDKNCSACKAYEKVTKELLDRSHILLQDKMLEHVNNADNQQETSQQQEGEN